MSVWSTHTVALLRGRAESTLDSLRNLDHPRIAEALDQVGAVIDRLEAVNSLVIAERDIERYEGEIRRAQGRLADALAMIEEVASL